MSLVPKCVQSATSMLGVCMRQKYWTALFNLKWQLQSITHQLNQCESMCLKCQKKMSNHCRHRIFQIENIQLERVCSMNKIIQWELDSIRFQFHWDFFSCKEKLCRHHGKSFTSFRCVWHSQRVKQRVVTLFIDELIKWYGVSKGFSTSIRSICFFQHALPPPIHWKSGKVSFRFSLIF